MIKKRLFIAVWMVLIVILAMISFTYRSKDQAISAVVESQVTAVSYEKPVIVDRLLIIPGQEVKTGDTLLVVRRPDLALDMERKANELDRINSQIKQERQDFERKLGLDQIDRGTKINGLIAERNELQAEIGQKQQILKSLSGSDETSNVDTVRQIRLTAVNQEIQALRNYYAREATRQELLLQEKIEILKKEKDIVLRELEALNEDASDLIKVARFHGIIGTVNVQLDELVEPFKNILSIYEVRPTVIKGYLREGISSPVVPGDLVRVVSDNRRYQIRGEVAELGARITAFPGKMQRTDGVVSYGQEIFIKIPRDNLFLNGEEVLVYPISKSGGL